MSKRKEKQQEKQFTMEICNCFDDLLEGLAYLGRRAAGRDWNAMAQRIAQQGSAPTPELLEALKVLQKLTRELDRRCPLEEDELQELFGNLEGFQHNTVGSSSRAFFLLYMHLDRYQGDLAAFGRQVAELDEEQAAWGIAGIFEEGLPASRRLTVQQYQDLVLGLSVPAGTKIALLELLRDRVQLIGRAVKCLAPVLECLAGSRADLEKVTRPFLRDCERMEPEALFSQLSRMTPEPGVDYLMSPFVFGADSNLALDLGDGRVRFYCGVLRRELQNLISGRNSAQDQVCEIYRLLGDPTRFDILCYLRGHDAYVQELSHQFGLSRNTIHHHMNKLMDCGLVNCMTNGNRMYYSLDRERMQLFLQRQKILFDRG